MRTQTVAWAALVLLLGLGLGALAQAEGTASLERWVFSAVGGPTSGSYVTVQQILGQPVVGESSGEHVSIRAGYSIAGMQPPPLQVYLPLVVRNH